MEVRRFGVGHRRAVGPPGSSGVEGVVLHSDARATITELAFARGAVLARHESASSSWLVVIEGGGYVLVGEEERRTAAGEAVLWPAGVVHGARTEFGPMRAILVELAGADDSHLRAVLEGIARRVGPGDASAVARGAGRLAERAPTAAERDREGEPA